MNGIIAQIESNGGTILNSAGECLLVCRKNFGYDYYNFNTALRHSYGDYVVFRTIAHTESELHEKAGTEAQRQQILADIANGEPIVYNKDWRSKILQEKDTLLVSDGENYVITRKYMEKHDKYSLEAPAHGRSGMADQFPWSRDITEAQAADFAAHPDKMLAYYQQIRYPK